MNLYQLTGTELDRAHEAADYLLSLQDKAEILETMLAAKLDTLRMDLTAEREERTQISRQ